MTIGWVCWIGLTIGARGSPSGRASLALQQQQQRRAAANGRSVTTPAPAPELQVLTLNAAGIPCEDSPMVEQSGTKCSLLAKNFGPLGCDRVLSELAAERGRSLDNIPSAFRNRRVADACPFSCGLCTPCAPGCTKWFIGNGWCEPACNNAACQFDGGDCWEKDCVVSSWSDWSECSKKCSSTSGGPAYERRTREILLHPTAGGKPCPKELEEKRYGCNEDIECPKDCEVSPWGKWSDCDVTCGQGTRVRARHVLAAAEAGGRECPPLEQSQPCFEKECESTCEVSEWSEWSTCSAPCGDGGTQIRTRHILSGGDQKNSGAVGHCPVLVEERPCQPALKPCNPNSVCLVSAWSEWSECNTTCGEGGVMTRERVFLKESEGADGCANIPLIEQLPCNTHSCPEDCEMSEWSEWSECQSSCGEGVQTRTRRKLRESGEGGRVCGALSETRTCYNRPCSQECTVSSWSNWSVCHSEKECGAGTQLRERHVISFPDQSGEPCPRLSEFRECTNPCPESPLGEAAADRQLSLSQSRVTICSHLRDQWSDWSTCEEACQTESRVRQRHQLIGLWTPTCDEVEQEQTCACDEPEIAVGLCRLSDWSKWTPCSAPCGGLATRKRYRSVIEQGVSCPFSLEETEACGTQPCPSDSCNLSPWSPWSECSASCGVGTTVRTRHLTAPSTDIDSSLCGVLEQVAACAVRVCDADCEVSNWSLWSECSERCGGGRRSRTRRITRHTTGAGALCPSLEELEDCNMQPCDSDCVLSEWSEWSECTGECGLAGSRTRQRSILKPQVGRGALCSRRLMETSSCEHKCSAAQLRQAQERANCKATPWSPWSACRGVCQEGITTRSRELISGSPLVCGPNVQEAPCTLPACQRDCEVGSWSEWSECSAQCGGGERWRSREIQAAPAGGGEPCPVLWESETCNAKACLGDDCVMSPWTEWSDCTEKCGGGVKERSRTVLQPPSGGGEPCGELHELRGCNLQRCAGQTCADNPLIESNGVSCSILKTQGCQTNLIELARRYDVSLPMNKIPPEARIQDACPETCGVCEECAPGCQLRDLGNTVCTEACNNEACQFDLGDCGADCSLSELKRSLLTTASVASALRVGDKVLLDCPPKMRIKGHASLSSVEAVCSVEKELVVPELGFAAVEDVQCVEDACPFIAVESDSHPFFSGVYHRFGDGHVKQVGLTALELKTIRQGKAEIRYVLSYPDRSAHHDPYSRIVELISAPCASNSALMCHGGVWYENARSTRVEDVDRLDQLALTDQIDSPVSLVCANIGAPTETQPSIKTGLKTGPTTTMPLPCEDVRLVQQFAGFSCTQLVESLGCDYKLIDAGRPLPPLMPPETTVGFVCPGSCGLCNPGGCAVGCADWFLSNGVCDAACNVPECAFDGGDCAVDENEAEQERALAAAGSSGGVAEAASTAADVAALRTTGAFQATRGVDPENCEDDPMVKDMGFSCQLLFMASQLKNGCAETIVGLAQGQGLSVALPPGVPADTRIMDACPETCKACGEERYLKKAAASFELQEVDYGETGCSDNDALVSSYASLTCSEITHILPDCSLSVSSLGYLPEGVPESLTLETLCPLSCKSCTNARAPRYQCHDFTILQTLSGFSCAQAVGLLGKATCTKNLASFGYELPAALPASLVLGDLCGVSCEMCVDESAPVQAQGGAGSTTGCVDDASVFDITGHECHAFVALRGVRCGDRFEALGYELPQSIPASAIVAQACPVSCDACRADTRAVCEDSALVAQTLKSSCDSLMTRGTCATLISDLMNDGAASLGMLASSAVGDLCRKSCGRCVARSSSGDKCEDHGAIANSGYSCQNIVRYAENGCATPLANVFGKHLIPVPDITLVSDACPRTCHLCVNEASEEKPIEPVCEDSSLLTAVNFACDQILQLAGGDGLGCTASLAELAGSTSFGALLPDGLVVKDLCKKTCKQCGMYSCQDGFQNGFEEYIDCGGKDCRVCNACQLNDLKNLAPHLLAVGLRDGGTFEHGAERELVCERGFHYTSTDTKIKCLDGQWTEAKGKCAEDTLPIWRATLGLTHAEDFMHDFVQNLAEALEVLFSLVTDSIDGRAIRILRAGSCSAMQTASGAADACADNPIVESMGFGCKMLAGFGCDNVLAELAASAGAALPAGIPSDATIGDACPKTCDTCELAAARMAQYLAETSTGPLGSDCFKADVGIDTAMNLPLLLNATLGRVENIERVLLAAVKDSVTTHNTTLMTGWVSGSVTSTEQRHLVKAVDFLNGRPVSLFLTEASTDDAAAGLGTSSATAVGARQLAPFALLNVTKSSWAKGASVSGGLELSRGVFVSNGLSPSFTFLETSQIVESIFPPLDDFSAEDITDVEDLVRFEGHFFQTAGSSKVGAVLDAAQLINIASCGASQTDQMVEDGGDSCCALRAELITHLRTDCGLWLMGEHVTASELQHLCLVSGPVNELETGSCYYRLKGMLHKYRMQGQPTCDAAELLNQLLDAWCHKDAAGEYCMTRFESDMKKFSITEFSLMLSDELDSVCEPSSCARNHVAYLHAITHMNVAWGLQTHLAGEGSSNVFRRSLMQISEWNTELAGLGYRLKDQWLLNQVGHIDHDATREAAVAGLLQHALGGRSMRRRLADSTSPSEELLPLTGAGEDILDLVCFKPFGSYCQHTLQLLITTNPVEQPSVTVPCSSACLSPLMTKLGVVVERQGRAINYPKHAVLGSALSSYGKHGCSKPGVRYETSGRPAASAANSCYNVYRAPSNWTADNLQIDRGEPPYDANKCKCSTLFLGDGSCDPECFSAACAYDGGDCFTENMFPTFLSSVLGAVCATSLADPCLPVNKNFQCTETCRSRIQTCMNSRGCCYAGAIETLKNMLDAESYVHQQVSRTASTDAASAWRNPFSLPPGAQGSYTPPFNTDWSMSWLEQTCGIALDRSCANGGKTNDFVVLVELFHLYVQDAASGSSLRLLGEDSPSFWGTPNGGVPAETALAVQSINEWLRSATARLRLADIFDMVSDDVYRVWMQPLAGNAVALVLHAKPGNDYSAVTAIRNFDVAAAESKLVRLLNSAPGVNDLRQNERTAISRVQVIDQNVASEKAGRTVTKRHLLGAWGFRDTSVLIADGCSLTDLYKTLGESQTPTQNLKSSFTHGEQVTTACAVGYAPVIDGQGNGVWQCVSSIWLQASGLFYCDLPCTNDVLGSLGLSKDRVSLQPVTNNPDVALANIPPWATLRSASSQSFKPGDAVLLACRSDLTIDMASGKLGVASSVCQYGRWSPVELDCQPACSAVPKFASSALGAYVLSGSDSIYGGVRNVSCAENYFANPPSYEGQHEIIGCNAGGIWGMPSFQCVLGITVDPSGNPSTVQKMLKTLFSRTGIISLIAFGSIAVFSVIAITLFWIFVYKHRADVAYIERKKLLQEYLSSAITSSGAGDGKISGLPETRAPGPLPQAALNNQSLIEGWEGRSPSSSTVSAFRRISMLRADR